MYLSYWPTELSQLLCFALNVDSYTSHRVLFWHTTNVNSRISGLTMKISLSPTLLSLSLLAGSVALTGCSGMVTSFPDTPMEITAGAIHGGVFGGHSPIVGAEIYVFQSGTTYKGASLNKLTVADAQGTDPTHGSYVLTNSMGAFSVSGDYTCTSGYPVYLAAVGGSTTPGATLLQITGSKKTASTVTLDTATPPAVGSQVTFGSGAFTKAGYVALNGTTQTVTAVGTSPASFSFANPTGKASGAGATGYALTGGLPNPAVLNIALLGNCPGTANEFASTLPFVYMSEVSTVAAANALAGFGTGPYDIGASSSNLNGIANAANTAGMMYNITTGGNALTSTSGGLYDQTHGTTSTGTVPQAELDTLGNLLASCVDSANTTASTSSQCSTLFDNATSNGVADGGTVPTDIATAAFNIAAHPAANVSALFALQAAGDAPFAPSLSSAPSDYTVTIAYSGGGLGATNGKSPHSVAVDATGNIYTVNFSEGLLSVFSPEGVPQSATGYSGSGMSEPVSVAVNSGSTDVFVTNNGGDDLSEFAVDGTAVTEYSLGTGGLLLRDAEFDADGNLWVSSDLKGEVYEVTASGSTFTSKKFAADKGSPYGVAVDSNGYIWLGDESATEATECNEAGQAGCANKKTGGINYAVGDAIDSRNNAWFGNSNGTFSAFNEKGTALTNSPYTTGSGTRIDGMAVDGVDNVWGANAAGDALYEFSTSYVAKGATDKYTVSELTPISGYSATAPDGLAIDGSGNVWYSSSSNAALYELVGAAIPVVTPTSAGVTNATIGTEP
jgi:sugar lactone lactonase YvrE